MSLYLAVSHRGWYHESSKPKFQTALDRSGWGLGLPCIASNIPQDSWVGSLPLGLIVDLIEGEKNGVRVPPQDPGALAAALHRVLTEPDFASELGRKFGFAHARRFSRNLTVRCLFRSWKRFIQDFWDRRNLL